MSIPISKYPYTDLHEMNMDWVIDQIKQLLEAWAETKGEWDDTEEAWNDLKTFVENYFNDLDVQAEVQAAIDQMIIDGTLQPIIAQVVADVYDAVPTQNSTMPVQSGGVYDALVQNWGGVNHNGIYRGKHLGPITLSNIDDFIAEHGIVSGDFTDLYLGDVVRIMDGVYDKQWMVAGFDYYFRKGQTDITQHHVILMPVEPLFDDTMNPTASTAGSYTGSAMFTTKLPALDVTLSNALGAHIMTISNRLGSAITGDKTSAWVWTTAKSILPTENQIYGSSIWGTPYDVGLDINKLPVFNFINHNEFGRNTIWLREVNSSTMFSAAGDDGRCIGVNANTSHGVSPIIAVG